MKVILFHLPVIFTIVIIALSPFIGVAVAGAIAEANGCDLDEGSIHPCMVGGRDLGKDLYTLFVLGWLGLATVPIGAITVCLYILGAAIFHVVRWRVRNRRNVNQQAAAPQMMV